MNLNPFQKKPSIWEEMGITRKNLAGSITLSLMFSAFGIVAITLYGLSNRSLVFSVDWTYFAYYMLSAPLQELLFRGFIQSRIQKASNGPVAIAVTAVLFSSVHFIWGIHLVLFTLPAGLVWGLIMWRRPNIAGPAISHFILGQYLLQFVI